MDIKEIWRNNDLLSVLCRISFQRASYYTEKIHKLLWKPFFRLKISNRIQNNFINILYENDANIEISISQRHEGSQKRMLNTCPFRYVVTANYHVVLQRPSIPNYGRVHPAHKHNEDQFIMFLNIVS